MRTPFCSAVLATLLLAIPTIVPGDESGPPLDVGDFVPGYRSVKCGGVDDRAKIGSALCYTCRLGDRPTVYVFARAESTLLK